MPKLSWKKKMLNPVNPLEVSYAAHTKIQCLIIKLEEDGFIGLGEATEFASYKSRIDEMIRILQSIKSQVENERWDRPFELYEKIHQTMRAQPFALSALDIAAHDLVSRKSGLTLRRYLGLDESPSSLSCMSIFRGSHEKFLDDLKKYRDWPVLKIKVKKGEQERIKIALKSFSGNIRIDANESFDLEEVKKYQEAFGREPRIEFLEQPFHRNDFESVRLAKVFYSTPIVADESCSSLASLKESLKFFDGVNLKLMKCGGITGTIPMIRAAREARRKVYLGCMPESSIGISASAQLASLADGCDLDSALLMKDDFAAGIRIFDGKIMYPNETGHGARLIL